jgi:hypothetical protein
MNKFQSMENYEINLAVAKIVLRGQLVEFLERKSVCEIGILDLMEDCVRIKTQSGTIQDLDFCRDVSQAWPIIRNNNITIVNDKGYKRATTNPHEEYETFGLTAKDGYFSCEFEDKYDDLRAAMIVFLMMNEVSDDEK